jgi:hypothetical protein
MLILLSALLPRAMIGSYLSVISRVSTLVITRTFCMRLSITCCSLPLSPYCGGRCHAPHFGPNIARTFQCVHGRPENEHQADLDAQKKAGLIENYSIFRNTTKANPDDWDLGFALSYKNFAALDGLAQKVLDLRMKRSLPSSEETYEA